MKQKDDAAGQFAKPHAMPQKDGVISAKPTVITESQDATAHRTPPGRGKPVKDWDVNFDETKPDRSR
jgi:hypothetical protein